jgi:hypothetical protein
VGCVFKMGGHSTEAGSAQLQVGCDPHLHPRISPETVIIMITARTQRRPPHLIHRVPDPATLLILRNRVRALFSRARPLQRAGSASLAALADAHRGGGSTPTRNIFILRSLRLCAMGRARAHPRSAICASRWAHSSDGAAGWCW